MARGKPPKRTRRARADDLPELLDNLRVATLNLHIAEGHVLAHRYAQTDAAQRAYAAGALHREILAACRRNYGPTQTAHMILKRRTHA